MSSTNKHTHILIGHIHMLYVPYIFFLKHAETEIFFSIQQFLYGRTVHTVCMSLYVTFMHISR